jgi:hypothetical protein
VRLRGTGPAGVRHDPMVCLRVEQTHAPASVPQTQTHQPPSVPHALHPRPRCVQHVSQEGAPAAHAALGRFAGLRGGPDAAAAGAGAFARVRAWVGARMWVRV